MDLPARLESHLIYWTDLCTGAIGGTQCAFAICFAKLLAKPLVTIVHSVTHNVDDALQVHLQLLGCTRFPSPPAAA